MMQVITFNQIVGFHKWPDAPEQYAYLKNSHRHVFFIRCWFDVTDSDREIEINDMQSEVERKIKSRFGRDHENYVCFGGMSCEEIALYCCAELGCAACEVLEDGFGGAYVRV